MILAACGLRREARLIAGPGIVAVAGGGDAAGLEAALYRHGDGATAILSIGLCGALAPGLAVGDWVIGSGETDPGWRTRLAALLPGASTGAVLGSDRMLVRASDKAAAYLDSGAIAVDMESHVAARVAARLGLPLAVLRVVSDRADADLPPAVLVGMRPDGGMALGAVLRSLARQPGQLPALLATARNAGRAFAVLGRLPVERLVATVAPLRL